jgi:hypothetical protein
MNALRLSYADLAARISRSPEGARQYARRRGWPISLGNDGRAVVLVEEQELADAQPRQPPVRPHVRTPVQTADQTTVRTPARTVVRDAELEQLRERVRELEAQAEHNRSALEVQRAVADLVQQQLGREIKRGDRLEGELREARRPWLVRVLAAFRR